MNALFARLRPRAYWLDWLIILLVVYLFSRAALLDFDPQQLQQTGEHNESATLPILAEIGLLRYGEIPLWNPYMLTGFPHAGDLINHFWNPVATLPVLLWGGVNGMKVSIFLSLLIAAFGQWFLAHVFGLRGPFRLWAGLLFALSGGLALLSWLGWYELLVGVAWFPWCFAALWAALRRPRSALRRRDRRSLVLTALAVTMVITAGGGYYPLYLAVSLAVLTGAALLWSPPVERGLRLRRAAAVALLAAGLSAVYLAPLADGLRYTGRDAPPDFLQIGSQPIPYALFNYVVSDPTWFRVDTLNKGTGIGWFYIGLLPLAALALLPWVYSRFPGRRRGILTLGALLLVLLLWHANRHLPVRALYDLLPFLHTFRFPNRLLIIAAVPLIVLAAIGLQGLLVRARRRWRSRTPNLDAPLLLNLAMIVLLAAALADVARVNRPFAVAPHARNQNARAALTWLRQQDTSLYYVNIGGTIIYWDWLAYAYELEMPVLNFRYNRRVLSMDAQYASASPFNAQPKYTFAAQDQTGPPGATQIAAFNEVNVWRRDDVLPFAFTVAPGQPIAPGSVPAVAVRLDGPNRVIVAAAGGAAGEQLVVLVSDYPGWRLTVDGQPASIQPVNGYLGAALAPGPHTYVFDFHPRSYDVGVAISLLTVALCVWLVAAELFTAARRARTAEL